MQKGALISLTIVLLFIVFFTDFFIKKNFLNKPIDFLKSVLVCGDLYQKNLFLKKENKDLKAQARLIEIRGGKKEEGEKLTAKIFSTDPFNIKNILTLNVGKKHGIKEGMTVTVSENILLGKITEVFENKSLAQTMFDPRWQMSVRIGKNKVNGFLSAGAEPGVVSLKEGDLIQIGDIVYSADSDFPYGLKIGEISKIRRTGGGLFKEAILTMPYIINDLREAYVYMGSHIY